MSGRKYIQSADHPYHITARTNNREWFSLDLNTVWEIFENQLFFIHHAFGIRIHAFVLMSNHFHLLASDPLLKLPRAMRWLMTETSREIGRRSGRQNRIYGQRNFKCLISNYHYFLHAYKYVYRNPVEAKACIRVEDYPFSTLAGLLGNRPLIIPLEEDLLFSDLLGNLKWLNAGVEKQDWESVRGALRKGEFKLRRDPHRNRTSHLDRQRI